MLKWLETFVKAKRKNTSAAGWATEGIHLAIPLFFFPSRFLRVFNFNS